MNALNGGFWGLPPLNSINKNKNKNKNSQKKRSSSKRPSNSTAVNGFRFPLKQALTASTLALTGDTIAQLCQRYINNKSIINNNNDFIDEESSNKLEALFFGILYISWTAFGLKKDVIRNLLSDHDWLRALRMTSYGFLLYGPGSYAWYQFLDHCMPKQNIQNLLVKVLLNQVVLGPIVIGVVFAWNNLWLRKLSELPNKYQKDALPTLLFGFRFWIPVSLLNFWLVPLQARVAFMSTGSIFWNFYLSSTMSK